MPDRGASTDDGAPAVVAPAFARGQVIAGRYRLESRLGAGGGGAVWRAFDEKLGAIVAFKIVDPDVDVERWRREVAMARRIADKNVCRVHDLGETPELRFVTMELVEGKSLRSKIHAELPVGEARALFRQIVAGTAAIHAAGVVHRDLKPENIVVDASGRAVIVDFGLAREPRGDSAATMNMRAASPEKPPSETVTSAGVVVGTPRYMSPEQAAGETVDARTDVWALGLIGHELLAGTLPALAANGSRHVGDLASWPDAAPVLQRCLRVMKDDRFADAAALLAAIAERPRGRSRIAIAAVAAVAATGAVFGVRALVAEDDKPATAPVRPIAGVKKLQITSTDPKLWPLEAPTSVAISRDAKRFAYTTPDTELFVRPLAGGDAKAWRVPTIERPAREPGAAPRQENLVAVWAVGWFGDNSIGLLASTRKNAYRLYRVYEDGKHELLYESSLRFPAAIAPNDAVLIAKPEGIGYLAGGFDLKLATDERTTQLAISPDGTRIASIRSTKASVTIYVDGTVVRSAAAFGELIAWLDDSRLAFVEIDPATGLSRIVVHDVRSGTATPRTEWSGDHVATGSAAGGSVLVLAGTANDSVQLAAAAGWPLARLHDPQTRGHSLAGWTSRGDVVFALGDIGKHRVVRVTSANVVEPWPNTTPGVELPDAVVGDDVITHKRDANEVVIERIDPSGNHVVLQRLPAMAVDTFVRCAGERAAPCMLERIDGEQVTWTELDPESGKLGRTYFAHAIVHPRSAALSHDAKVLAFVGGTNQVIIEALDTELADQQTTFDDVDALESITFLPNRRDAWISVNGLEGHPFAFARIVWSDKMQRPYSNVRGTRNDQAAMRWFWRPTASPDDKRVAVVVRELRLEVTRIDGL